jgi:serine/threonine-protein kinase
MKDTPASLPERRRQEAATVVNPRSAPATKPEGADSYQPDLSGATERPPGPPPEVLVGSTATVEEILEEIRKPPAARLDIENRIGGGGMGSVDIAVDRALDRRIAVKTLHQALRYDDLTVRMFLREARLTALLDHPHIVHVYDIGEREGDELYFSMKLVEGRTLGDLISTLPKGPLDTGTLYELLDIVTKVCDALAFAHSRGVLHCDLKPSNVMVGEFGEVYLMDWGIARIMAADSSRRSDFPPPSTPDPTRSPSITDNSIIGTPAYMSPEQARGDRASLDARSDVFLLGGLLYEILTRRPPYSTKDNSEVLSLATSCTFPAPRKVAGDGAVPAELERIVLRAMARDPAHRYPEVKKLKDDLVQFMRGGAEFPRKTFAAGTRIVSEGEPGDAAYIIVTGRCEIRKEGVGGTTEVLRVLGPGDVFGEMAILTAGPRTATVVATDDTTALVVTSANLEQELAALKPWMATLLKSVAARFRDVDNRQRATSTHSPTATRIANQLLMNAMTWGTLEPDGSRWLTWSALGPELEAQLGQPPMALFMAISRYGMQLQLDADRLVLPDPAGLAERLKAEKKR